jgi:hypothetical protein
MARSFTPCATGRAGRSRAEERRPLPGGRGCQNSRLCEQLDVTKGSFYRHFTDIGEYRSALAGTWGSLHDERRRRFGDIQ